ncbi:MAG: hypothetical protein LBB63_02675 [Holosporaceae bacterium]|nr:hypothetical protein [Holosporaceae bacterium]
MSVDTNGLGHKLLSDAKSGAKFSPQPLYSKCLDEICSNFAGNTAVKLLTAKLETNREKLHLIIGDHNGSDGKNTITINPAYFDVNGNSKYTLCGVVYGTDKLVAKRETMSEAVFREICRIIQKYNEKTGEGEGSALLDGIYLDDIHHKNRPEKELWINDGNVRAISGYYYNRSSGKIEFDPVCSNMYTICSQGPNAVQQVFACFYEHCIKKDVAALSISKLLIDPKQWLDK